MLSSFLSWKQHFFVTPVTQSNCLSLSHCHAIGHEWSLLQQEEEHSKKARLSPAVTLKCQREAFRCKVQLSCCAGPAGCGGRRRPWAGLDRAGLLGCWASGRPRRGLAGWASSMERLIPARTKSLPVVPLAQQRQKKCSMQSHCNKYCYTALILQLYFKYSTLLLLQDDYCCCCPGSQFHTTTMTNSTNNNSNVLILKISFYWINES